jgi:hypothetical protein
MFQQAKVPGDLTCAAHSVVLSILAVATEHPEWFISIKPIFTKLVRKTHDVDGTFIGYEIKPHLLRELVPEVVVERGSRFFQQMFGTIWYWGEKEANNIYGYNEATSERPHERDFMEYADPFFMVCSYLFQCKIMVRTQNGLRKEFCEAWSNQKPTLNIHSNMGSSAGTHFDSMLSSALDKVWFPDPSHFFEAGEPYIIDNHKFRDIVPRIDLWHFYLGDRYQEVLAKVNRFTEEKESQELAEHLALKFLQEDAMLEEDARLAAELHDQLN